MFQSRKIHPETGVVEIWECEWSNESTGVAKKVFLRKVGNEHELEFNQEDFSPADAICWAPGRTIGNIAVNINEVVGMFKGSSGEDALLPCQIVPCGKFRHGAKRWYCKTHQIHWGTKADFKAVTPSGEIKCGNHQTKMAYVVSPLEIEFNNFEEIGIWCSLPPGLSSKNFERKPPKIHVHKRYSNVKEKLIDGDYDAIICSLSENVNLFENTEIKKIQLTPPAAFEFVSSIEYERATSCISCKKCGYPHLDLGDFALQPHKKHFCGNCGNDSIWSKEAIVSTPLKPLHDFFSKSDEYIYPDRTLNLDEYKEFDFDVWASTPAVVWTANRPQEKGIHVHVYNHNERVVDDTFSSVIYKNIELDRKELYERMTKNTIFF